MGPIDIGKGFREETKMFPDFLRHALTDFRALMITAELSRSLFHEAADDGVRCRSESATANL